MGGVAPNYGTPEVEWVERLDVIPMNPVMSLPTLRHYAGYAGRRLLDYVHDHNGEFPSADMVRMVLQAHRITQR
jgi:hypothetical protein